MALNFDDAELELSDPELMRDNVDTDALMKNLDRLVLDDPVIEVEGAQKNALIETHAGEVRSQTPSASAHSVS